MRPLASIRSLKLKFSIVIVVAVVVTALMANIGLWLGWPVWLRPIIAAGLSLLMVQFLAKGATRPLREMAHAAELVTAGDYSQRVETTSIDEVGQLAASFNTMAGELGDVERQQKELVANVSHELRTPIAAIQINLENLVDGVTDWDTERGEVMLRQTERLSRLVTQLLDLAKLESGAAPLQPRAFVVGPLLDAVVAEVELHGHDVSLVVEVEDDLKMIGDPERLHQLVTNLVDNAIHHSPAAGTVRVRAQSHPSSSDADTGGASVLGGGSGDVVSGLRLTVSDEGPGIPIEERERIFERFHRVDQDRSTRSGGSGLGLSIARWIVELHHGSIHATDNAPHGACLVVDLPNEPPP